MSDSIHPNQKDEEISSFSPSNTAEDCVPDTITADAEDEVLDEEPKNIILGMISQLRKGADLSRITLPTFVLEPRSMCERITDFMCHPDFILEYVSSFFHIRILY